MLNIKTFTHWNSRINVFKNITFFKKIYRIGLFNLRKICIQTNYSNAIIHFKKLLTIKMNVLTVLKTNKTFSENTFVLTIYVYKITLKNSIKRSASMNH